MDEFKVKDFIQKKITKITRKVCTFSLFKHLISQLYWAFKTRRRLAIKWGGICLS
jgi:hypothetical protein